MGAVSPADPLERPLVGQDGWFLQQTKKQRVKVSGGHLWGGWGDTPGWGAPNRAPHPGFVSPPQRPARLQTKPSQVPAVEVIAAGGSYNPTFEDHQVWGQGGARRGVVAICDPFFGGGG